MQDDITYLPAVDLAEAAKVSLGWKPDEKVLVSSYGQAVGYKKKDTLVPVVENGKSVKSGAAKTDAEVYAEATKETAKDVKDAKAAAKEVKAEAKAK